MKERPSARDSTRDDLNPCFSNDPEEEEIYFIAETENGTSEEEVHVEYLACDYDVKDLPKEKSTWAEFIATKKEITTIFEMESDDSASYPADCYSLISLNGPRVRYFWFGLMVFLFQVGFLLVMLLSVMLPHWKTGQVDDNPTSNICK